MHFRAALIIATVFTVAGCSNFVEPSMPFSGLEGNWGFADAKTCEYTYQAISFSPGQTKMHLIYWYAKLIDPHDMSEHYSYYVESHTNTSVLLIPETGTEKDANGNVITWRVGLLSDGALYWRRSDWKKGVHSLPAYRCRNLTALSTGGSPAAQFHTGLLKR